MNSIETRTAFARRRAVILTALTGAVTAAALIPLALPGKHGTAQATAATLYKNPECECCDGYAAYLRENGFEVTVKATHDVPLMQQAAGVPEGFVGCHLTMIADYAVAGHIPIATINRLLGERPAIKGVVLPGMPMGSPGMGGTKEGPFVIYEIGGESKVGVPNVYATE